MDQGGSFRIQVEAAHALAEWKVFFAEQVALKARELAKIDNSPGVITLDHYRQAASFAAQMLATAVQDTSDGRREAA